MIKLLLISNMYPSNDHPYKGIFIKNIVEDLRKSNFQFGYMAVIKGDTQNIVKKIIKYITFYCQIIFYGLLGNYSLIYAHYISHCCIPLLFLKLTRKVPIIINIHGTDIIPNNLLHTILQPFVKLILNKADDIITPSYFFKQYIVQKHKVSDNKIFISPSGGVDLETFRPVKNKEHIRNKYELSQDDFITGYVSRITEDKGWRLFINTLNILIKNYSRNIKGVMAGSGPKASELLDSISNLQIDHNIKYLGTISHEKLWEVFNLFDVFIFPTKHYESLGFVALESLACGVPVIGSNRGAIPEYISEGENGLLFDVGDKLMLAEKVKLLYSDKNLRYRLSKNARTSVLKYDKKIVITNLKQRLEISVKKIGI